MKEYVFEAAKKQLDRTTQPKYVFCPDARITVFAETEEEAAGLAEQELRQKFLGTGFLTGKLRLAQVIDLPLDWNYGYGDGRGIGDAGDRAALRRDCTK